MYLDLIMILRSVKVKSAPVLAVPVPVPVPVHAARLHYVRVSPSTSEYLGTNWPSIAHGPRWCSSAILARKLNLIARDFSWAILAQTEFDRAWFFMGDTGSD